MAWGARPPSQIETALSLPRPDPASVWLAQQSAVGKRLPPRSTGVLIAVALVSALSFIGVSALILFKVRSAGGSTAPAAAPEAQVPSVTPAPPAPVLPALSAVPTTAAPSATSAPNPGPAPIEPAAVAAQPKPAPAVPGMAVPGAQTGAAAAFGGEQPGFLTIICTPFCDEVLDGGRSLGPSPVVQLAVKPGPHRITLKRTGLPPKVISVIVVSGQPTAHRVHMK